jgi:hypothetical protein
MNKLIIHINGVSGSWYKIVVVVKDIDHSKKDYMKQSYKFMSR